MEQKQVDNSYGDTGVRYVEYRSKENKLIASPERNPVRKDGVY